MCQQRSHVGAPVPPRIRQSKIRVLLTSRRQLDWQLYAYFLPRGRRCPCTKYQTIATAKTVTPPLVYTIVHADNTSSGRQIQAPFSLRPVYVVVSLRTKRKKSVRSHQNKPYPRGRPVAHKYVPSKMLRQTAGVAPPSARGLLSASLGTTPRSRDCLNTLKQLHPTQSRSSSAS